MVPPGRCCMQDRPHCISDTVPALQLSQAVPDCHAGFAQLTPRPGFLQTNTLGGLRAGMFPQDFSRGLLQAGN